MNREDVPERHVVSASDVTWNEEADVVIVGSGIAGATAAFGALKSGARPLVLERAATTGGTFAKSAGAFWIPGNEGLRARGVVDDPADALRFVARCARPVSYDPDSPTLGLERWEFDLLDAYVRRGHDVVLALEAEGALTADFPEWAPDYQAQMAENTVKQGRVGTPMAPDGVEPLRGVGQAHRFVDELGRRGVEIRVSQRVVAVVVDDGGAVLGVRVVDGGGPRHVRARGGVVFASGGFTHGRDLRRNHLSAFILGGAAVHGNTGDFVRIASELGLPLHGMSDPWMAPIPLELLDDEKVCPVFVTPGDSMVFVNRYGKRVLNEKGSYNEIARVFGAWDPLRMEYPNLLMFMIFDDRVRELWGPPPDYDPALVRSEWPLESLGDYSNDDRVVVSASGLAALAGAIQERLDASPHLPGGIRLDDGFVEATRASIERFNALARAGLDEDFGRGQKPIERMWAGEHRPGNDLPDPTMFPISPDGPLHAVILAAGTLDTRGGPRINPDGQVLDALGAPVRGLYGAGNCVASPFVQGYPAGGVPNGSAMIFGYAAGLHAGAEATSRPEES